MSSKVDQEFSLKRCIAEDGIPPRFLGPGETSRWRRHLARREIEHDALMVLLEAFSEEIFTAIGKGLPLNGERRVREALREATGK